MVRCLGILTWIILEKDYNNINTVYVSFNRTPNIPIYHIILKRNKDKQDFDLRDKFIFNYISIIVRK